MKTLGVACRPLAVGGVLVHLPRAWATLAPTGQVGVIFPQTREPSPAPPPESVCPKARGSPSLAPLAWPSTARQACPALRYPGKGREAPTAHRSELQLGQL